MRGPRRVLSASRLALALSAGVSAPNGYALPGDDPAPAEGWIQVDTGSPSPMESGVFDLGEQDPSASWGESPAWTIEILIHAAGRGVTGQLHAYTAKTVKKWSGSRQGKAYRAWSYVGAGQGRATFLATLDLQGQQRLHQASARSYGYLDAESPITPPIELELVMSNATDSAPSPGSLGVPLPWGLGTIHLPIPSPTPTATENFEDATPMEYVAASKSTNSFWEKTRTFGLLEGMVEGGFAKGDYGSAKTGLEGVVHTEVLLEECLPQGGPGAPGGAQIVQQELSPAPSLGALFAWLRGVLGL